jgi:xanthine dehydrogenase accessory factor
MKALLEAVLNALKREEDAVLCSVIASYGSTPRGKGAKMVVFKDGSTMGTVGGGAIEYHTMLAAKEAIEKKLSFVKSFDLSSVQAANIGMICGGGVEVNFLLFSAHDKHVIDALKHIVSLFDKNEEAWLITDISKNALGVYTKNEGVRFVDIEEERILPQLKAGGILQREEPSFYVEPLMQPGYVYVFGGGHVSQELVPVIEHVGFRPVVYEDRAEFADPSLFPNAVNTILGSFSEIGSKLTITCRDYIVILTRGHQADYETLLFAIKTDASYIGMIGSRGKIAASYKRLAEAGIDESEISRIHAPIGLPIKGETPAEIAISIAAELILHRAMLLQN